MDQGSVLPLVHALGYQQLLVFAERRGSDEERYARLLAMRPEPDDYARVFGPALVERARALYGELWQQPPPLAPKPGPTELWLRSALSEDFAAWNERGSEFPGGYRKLGPDLVPGVVWLAFKFVAPGDFSGLSFDGLAWVNQRLVWFPQPWRLVPMGAGAPEPEAPPTAPTAAPPTSPPTAPRTVGAMAAADAHLSPSDFVRRMRRADLWPPDIVGSEVVLRLSGGSNADLLFSWAVFAPRRGPQAIIREVTTERGVVQRILRGARETRETLLGSGLVRVRDVTVAVGEVASLLDEARGMHIPIVGVTPTIGFDGTTYTMSSDFGLSASELVWWSGGPPEWQALTRWAAATRKRLHGWVAPGTPLDD